MTRGNNNRDRNAAAPKRKKKTKKKKYVPCYFFVLSFILRMAKRKRRGAALALNVRALSESTECTLERDTGAVAVGDLLFKFVHRGRPSTRRCLRSLKFA